MWLLDPDNMPSNFHQILSRFNVQPSLVNAHQVYVHVYVILHKVLWHLLAQCLRTEVIDVPGIHNHIYAMLKRILFDSYVNDEHSLCVYIWSVLYM